MNNFKDSVRVDRWLWAVRICKTRTMATDLCKRQRVSIDGLLAKPSREVRPGQTVALNKEGLTRQYRVTACINNRVSAKLAAECKIDTTPPEEVARWRVIRAARMPQRDKGAGRPTKKDRRALDKSRNLA